MSLLVAPSSGYVLPAQIGQKWWNQDRVEYLKQRWEDGASASQIGGEMHITRNAIIGKVHRLHLPLRKARAAPAEAETEKSKKPHMAKKNRLPAGPPMPAEPMPAPAPLPVGAEIVSFMDLQEHHCRYPIELTDGSTAYCGSHKVDGLPYCAYHAKRCYNPVHR